VIAASRKWKSENCEWKKRASNVYLVFCAQRRLDRAVPR
jgi:hypothetical protein